MIEYDPKGAKQILKHFPDLKSLLKEIVAILSSQKRKHCSFNLIKKKIK